MEVFVKQPNGCISHSRLSQAVKELEAELEVQLERTNQGARLTAEGSNSRPCPADLESSGAAANALFQQASSESNLRHRKPAL